MKLLLIFPMLLSVSCSVIGTRSPQVEMQSNKELQSFLDANLVKTSNTFRLIETVSNTLTSVNPEKNNSDSRSTVLSLISNVLSDSGVGRIILSESQTNYDYFVKSHVVADLISEVKVSGSIEGDDYLMSSLSIRINDSRYFEFFKRQTEGTKTFMEMNFTEITAFGSALKADNRDFAYPQILGSLFVRIAEGRTIIQTTDLSVDSGPYMVEIDGLKLITDENSQNFSEARIKGAAYDKKGTKEKMGEIDFFLDEDAKTPVLKIDLNNVKIDEDLAIDSYSDVIQ